MTGASHGAIYGLVATVHTRSTPSEHVVVAYRAFDSTGFG